MHSIVSENMLLFCLIFSAIFESKSPNPWCDLSEQVWLQLVLRLRPVVVKLSPWRGTHVGTHFTHSHTRTHLELSSPTVDKAAETLPSLAGPGLALH